MERSLIQLEKSEWIQNPDSESSEDEYELPLRPREDYKESRILKVRLVISVHFSPNSMLYHNDGHFFLVNWWA